MDAYNWDDNSDSPDDDDPISFDWVDIPPAKQNGRQQPNFGIINTRPCETTDRTTDEIVYGEYPSNNGYDDESDSRSGGGQNYRTVDSERHREQERLARSRTDTSRLPFQSPRGNAPGDAERRVDEQNKKSLAEAVRRWSKQRGNSATGIHDTSLREAIDGGNVAVQTDSGRVTYPVIVTTVPLPEFPGCEFEGVLNKLYLANNGEWIVQFRVSYETKDEAGKLDQTPGMSLKIRVDQI